MKVKILKTTGEVVELDLDNLIPLLYTEFNTEQVPMIIKMLEYHFTEAVK